MPKTLYTHNIITTIRQLASMQLDKASILKILPSMVQPHEEEVCKAMKSHALLDLASRYDIKIVKERPVHDETNLESNVKCLCALLNRSNIGFMAVDKIRKIITSTNKTSLEKLDVITKEILFIRYPIKDSIKRIIIDTYLK